jgi:hypothetical protein
MHGEAQPCPGWIVGYTAIIETLKLRVPLPAVKAMVSEKEVRQIEATYTSIFTTK